MDCWCAGAGAGPSKNEINVQRKYDTYKSPSIKSPARESERGAQEEGDTDSYIRAIDLIAISNWWYLPQAK